MSWSAKAGHYWTHQILVFLDRHVNIQDEQIFISLTCGRENKVITADVSLNYAVESEQWKKNEIKLFFLLLLLLFCFIVVVVGFCISDIKDDKEQWFNKHQRQPMPNFETNFVFLPSDHEINRLSSEHWPLFPHYCRRDLRTSKTSAFSAKKWKFAALTTLSFNYLLVKKKKKKSITYVK